MKTAYILIERKKEALLKWMMSSMTGVYQIVDLRYFFLSAMIFSPFPGVGVGVVLINIPLVHLFKMRNVILFQMTTLNCTKANHYL